MAIEYELVLSSGTSAEVLMQRAVPDPSERPAEKDSPIWAPLYDTYGFAVIAVAARSRYVDVMSDNGSWEWEPEPYASVTFRMDKFADPHWNVVNMLTVVRRVLDSGTEDAAFMFNGDVLLLTRFDGVLVKHRRQRWWDHYPGANEALPG